MDQTVLHAKSLHSCLFATLWTVAHQVLLSMGFSRQEYWSGLSFPSPGHPPHPGVKPGSPALHADSFLFFSFFFFEEFPYCFPQ